MNFRIPIFVHQHKGGYAARPLFAPGEHSDGNLNRLLTRLTRELVQQFEHLGKQGRHDDLARWAFCPPVTTHRVALEVELRRRIARVKYLLVAFDHMGRRLAFTPAVPDLWFEVTRGEPLEARAQAVYTEHWRQVERDAGAVLASQVCPQHDPRRRRETGPAPRRLAVARHLGMPTETEPPVANRPASATFPQSFSPWKKLPEGRMRTAPRTCSRLHFVCAANPPAIRPDFEASRFRPVQMSM